MKKIWLVIKKYLKEIIFFLIGAITTIILTKKKREEDILSEVANRVDNIEMESKEKADEVKRKIEIIKTLKDKEERMRKLLDLKRELNQL